MQMKLVVTAVQTKFHYNLIFQLNVLAQYWVNLKILNSFFQLTLI